MRVKPAVRYTAFNVSDVFMSTVLLVTTISFRSSVSSCDAERIFKICHGIEDLSTEIVGLHDCSVGINEVSIQVTQCMTGGGMTRRLSKLGY